jgi:sigma-B regulation protein RsbU (phosphoserine phosphatase)
MAHSGRFLLTAPASAPGRRLTERVRDFLLRRWLGRVFIVVAALQLAATLAWPLPTWLASVARGLFRVYLLGFAVVLLRLALRHLLFRIRTKLILSYLFIAVVPVVLLSLFFAIAAALGAGLMASSLVIAELDRIGSGLRDLAQSALTTLPLDQPQVALGLEERLAPARRVHPGLAWSLVQGGRVLASSGKAPRGLPAWLQGPGFAGLVREAEGQGEVVRAVWKRGDAFLLVDAPVDARLFEDLERRTGIHLVSFGGTIEARRGGGLEVRLPGDRPREARARLEADGSQGIGFIATPERTDWATGKQEVEPVSFSFEPWAFARGLARGSVDPGDILIKVLAVVGAVFLVMYAVALLIGLLLARSITKSVHALHLGTEKIRSGDFGHTIRVRSRDQLGELATSFNMMSRGIQDLLMEQREKERLEEELRIARTIQMSLLPQGSVGLPGVRIAALCLPATEVGGDYYDLLPLSETRMAVVVADVSGKGTSAALYMAELKGLILSLSRIYDSPARVLCEANRILSTTLDPRSFITMTYAVVDTAARAMRYARAGHSPLIHFVSETGGTRVLAPPGLGLGMDSGPHFEAVLEEASVPLVSADVFLFFTDGLSEAMNEHAEMFGEARLRQVIEVAQAEGVDEVELKERILGEVRRFIGGAAPHDDMTLVLLKVA